MQKGKNEMNGRKINLLSVSGGKDSTALILHALETGAERVRYVFADTGNEHDDVYTYLDYLELALGITIQRVKADFAKKIEGKRKWVAEKWPEHGISAEVVARALELLHPTGNPFLDMCVWKGRFPSTKARFCTDELKVIPITNDVVIPLLKAGQRVRSWQGVRAQESARRATYKMHEQVDLGVWAYRPLLHWTHDDVFAIHRKHGISPNPLYSKGMSRVGCMPCIMCRKDELSEIARRFPEVIERLAKWEQVVSETCKRGSGTFFGAETTGGESDEDISYLTHGIKSAVDWSMTTRGGVQYDLFKATDDIPYCSSHYGLCEAASPVPQFQTKPCCS